MLPTPEPRVPRQVSTDSRPRFLIIADDLTGACDAAAPFAMRGQKVEVQLSRTRDVPDSCPDVISVNTEGRDTSESLSLLRLRATLRELQASVQGILFKKVDSLCRGNTFAEIRVIDSEFPEHLIFFTPSFPAAGRRVTSGFLRLNFGPESAMDITEALTSRHILHTVLPEGISADARVARMQSAVANGIRFFLCDASTDAEMHSVVQAALLLNRRLIWIGSGGLAHALANTLCGEPSAASSWSSRNGALLLCIGSTHATTSQQIEHTIRYGKTLCVNSTESCVASLPGHLESKGTLTWVINPELSHAEIRDTLMPVREYPETTLLLSGGDTAARVCNAFSVQSISIAGELMPGIPWGFIRGGECDGMRVITKSGGFGSVDALTTITQICNGGLP